MTGSNYDQTAVRTKVCPHQIQNRSVNYNAFIISSVRGAEEYITIFTYRYAIHGADIEDIKELMITLLS